jgi:hypothetical protein
MGADVFNVHILELEGLYSDKRIDCPSICLYKFSTYTGITFKVM